MFVILVPLVLLFLVFSRGQDVIPWDLLAEIDFFCFKLFFDTQLMEKNWVPFFPAKIRVFVGSILKNLTEKWEIRE